MKTPQGCARKVRPLSLPFRLYCPSTPSRPSLTALVRDAAARSRDKLYLSDELPRHLTFGGHGADRNHRRSICVRVASPRDRAS